MNITRKLRNIARNRRVRQLAFITTAVLVNMIMAIVIFNLLGQGLIASAVSFAYWASSMVIMDDAVQADLEKL